MLKVLTPILSCPTCSAERALREHAFGDEIEGHIQHGVLVCDRCRTWYPIDDGLLELVQRSLAVHDDLALFCRRWKAQLESLHLSDMQDPLPPADFSAQLKQREHFDWYADNGRQSYFDYQTTPFWTAVDEAAFGRWLSQIERGAWLLDVGCANGRSAFRLVESGVNVVGFDISKKMIRQAINRAKEQGLQRRTTFLVGDGNEPPFASGSFDCVLTYGVLHHLSDPGAACRRIQQILKPGGVFFGSENNKSVFRCIFDLLMRVMPLWTEEAGAEPLISRQMLSEWHAELPATIHAATSVFLPPHLLNLAGSSVARRLLSVTDKFASRIPGLREHGGLIVFEVHKPGNRTCCDPIRRAA